MLILYYCIVRKEQQSVVCIVSTCTILVLLLDFDSILPFVYDIYHQPRTGIEHRTHRAFQYGHYNFFMYTLFGDFSTISSLQSMFPDILD